MALARNTIEPVCSSLFGFSKEEQSLTAFISDIPRSAFFRIWDDSIDIGFKIRSKKTGNCITFVENHKEYLDGDLIYMDYVPVVAGSLPARKISVRLFND